MAGWVVGKLDSNAKLNSKLRLKLKLMLELSLEKKKSKEKKRKRDKIGGNRIELNTKNYTPAPSLNSSPSTKFRSININPPVDKKKN